ncbi:U2-type spliceosomal complex subunit CWC24 [Aspergillus candidus]|uniref:Pre-mRNA-splicing factor CWC24 n=1 Tax=Aspergillus candidus TaxID=41067 RepID=A0A2I2EXU7_ASPCN|nr:putative CCCH and RING finger protein [Aspergillus candidus]PLB33203.1 putative CCCH and RING finger protein [Aspergillus candidus]
MADAPITFKKRSAKAKATVRKKEAPPPASDSDSGFTSSDDDQGQRIKRRRKNAAVTASSTTAGATRPVENPAPASTAPAPLQSTNDATKQSNWYDEKELDAKNLLGTTRSTGTPSAPDGTYKGAANYQSFIQKNPDAPGKKFGPVKAPTNVRAVTFMDYMPNVCKDYKKTGFCGYGDSCIYAHMREDYKQGWELDQDWDKATDGDKKKVGGQVVSRRSGADAKAGHEDDEDEALLESIPFACIICEKPYQYPITTKCGHYFCEACALKRYRKDPSCAACGASTGGVFNTAKKLNQLLERKRERARRAGEDESDAESD